MRYTVISRPLSLIVSAAALLGCSLASAQTLTIDSITTNLQNIAGQSSVTIDPATGNVVVRSANGSACAAAPQPTAALSAPGSAQSQSSITVSWTSTNTSGTTPCTPSSSPANASWNNAGALAATGARSVTMPLVSAGSQIQQLTMTCQGAAGTTPAVNTVSITVTAIDNTACADTPEAGLAAAGATRTWMDVFGQGAMFPSPFGNAREVTAGASQFTAISFTTPSAGLSTSSGNITTAQSTGQSGPHRISFSKCLGDFRPVLRASRRCMTVGDSSQQTLTFLVGTGGTSAVCNLEPQTQYYFNLTYKVLAVPGSDPDGPVSAGDCGNGAGGNCISIVRTGQFRRDQLIELGLPTEDVPGN